MAHSANLTPAAYDAAVRRAAKENATQPRASSVRYDTDKDVFVLTLGDDIVLTIPRRRIPGLVGDDLEKVRHVKLEGDGEYLRWSELDVDHSVPLLVADVFDFRTVQENARRAGSVRSAAKTAAVRRNGKKGGRPRKKAA